MRCVTEHILGVRHGAAYVMVLACATIVTAITLGGLALSRVQRDAFAEQESVRRARLAAASGLEAATRVLSPTVAGRRAIGVSDGLPSQIDGVAVAYDVVDTIDANVTNDITQAIDVTVEARIGATRQMLAGTLKPRLTPVGMAKYGLAATGAVRLVATTVEASAGVYSATGFTASGASVASPVYHVGTATGDSYLSTKSSVAPESMPDASDPTALLTRATRISYNSISGGNIDGVVISPQINPYGAATNANGIYLIDCGGERLRIRNSRIIGTLIVLNAKSDSSWQNGVNISTYDARLPAVMWQGGLTVSTSAGDLLESAAGASLNPPGAPYQGQTNTNKTDQFPSKVTGTMVVIGTLTVDGSLTVDGRVLVMGPVSTSNATIRIRPDPDNVVPDCLYEADGFDLIAGTARRVVDQ